MLLAGWCQMVEGCEEAIHGIMDWCANFPQEENEVSAKSKLWRYDGKGPCPVWPMSHFVACPVDWLRANFGNDVMNEPLSISIIPKQFARWPSSSDVGMF
ncbi:hypothetical protein AVEN_235911-1 [Araneus ventricosus]|uniref:Uncharacterized protein n=1 Tax=Araneus ventricosus TaxID=182803 RepID=A0A4Y2NX72_ARAVE|nr:hypothetical protein AVEN_235911-1 [Araneus ventricosus]